MAGEQVIEDHVDDDARVPSERRLETAAGDAERRMGVGERVDAAVQTDTGGDPRREAREIPPAHEVAGELPDEQ